MNTFNIIAHVLTSLNKAGLLYSLEVYYKQDLYRYTSGAVEGTGTIIHFTNHSADCWAVFDENDNYIGTTIKQKDSLVDYFRPVEKEDLYKAHYITAPRAGKDE